MRFRSLMPIHWPLLRQQAVQETQQMMRTKKRLLQIAPQIVMARSRSINRAAHSRYPD
jgi:hypothetical protein